VDFERDAHGGELIHNIRESGVVGVVDNLSSDGRKEIGRERQSNLIGNVDLRERKEESNKR
jgi:hypothetical protein